MRASTAAELERDPVGRYVTGQTFVHFCAQPGLWGILLWGRPSRDDAMALYRTLVFELSPPAQPHASIVDASRLEGADATTFGLLDKYMTMYGRELAAWVERLAIVKPRGFEGAIVAGAYEVVPRPYPVAVYDDARAALDWLASHVALDPGPEEIAREMSVLLGEAASTAPILALLRPVLDGHLGGIALVDAARTVGMSERTLQRRLGEAGVTFQDELQDARIRAAKRRLTDTDDPITTIAFDVGCASLQHLNALFRKRTGQSPSAFRNQSRPTTVAGSRRRPAAAR